MDNMDDPRWTQQDPELLKEFYERHGLSEEIKIEDLVWNVPEEEAAQMMKKIKEKKSRMNEK